MAEAQSKSDQMILDRLAEIDEELGVEEAVLPFAESEDLELMRTLSKQIQGQGSAPPYSNIAAQLAMVRNPAFAQQWQTATRGRVNAAREFFKQQGLISRQAASEEQVYAQSRKRAQQRRENLKRERAGLARDFQRAELAEESRTAAGTRSSKRDRATVQAALVRRADKKDLLKFEQDLDVVDIARKKGQLRDDLRPLLAIRNAKKDTKYELMVSIGILPESTGGAWTQAQLAAARSKMQEMTRSIYRELKTLDDIRLRLGTDMPSLKDYRAEQKRRRDAIPGVQGKPRVAPVAGPPETSTVDAAIQIINTLPTGTASTP